MASIEEVEAHWNEVTSSVETGTTIVGAPRRYNIGNGEGLLSTVEDTAEDMRGWIAVALANDYVYVFLMATTPSYLFEDYEDTFADMLASVEFFPPTGVE